MLKVEVFGEVPLARFGHTMTLGKLFKHSVKEESCHVWRSNWRYWKIRDNWRYLHPWPSFKEMDKVRRWRNRSCSKSCTFIYKCRYFINGCLWRSYWRWVSCKWWSLSTWLKKWREEGLMDDSSRCGKNSWMKVWAYNNLFKTLLTSVWR